MVYPIPGWCSLVGGGRDGGGVVVPFVFKCNEDEKSR